MLFRVLKFIPRTKAGFETGARAFNRRRSSRRVGG